MTTTTTTTTTTLSTDLQSLDTTLIDLALRLRDQENQDMERIDILRTLWQDSKLLYATQYLKDLIIKDSRMPGGIFELNHSSPQGSVLTGEGARLFSLLQVTHWEDVRLLSGVTEIDAVVCVGKLAKLYFHFRRTPGPRKGSSIPYTQHQEEDSDEEEENDEEEEIKMQDCGRQQQENRKRKRNDTNNTKLDKKNEEEEQEPTTILEYTISASPNDPAEIPVDLLNVAIYGLHASGAPSPAGVRDPNMEEGKEKEEGKDVKDICVTEIDGEALEATMEWCKTTLTQPEFLSFLMLFPYHEEEWDVGGSVLDQLLGFGEEEEEEEGDEEEEEEEEDEEDEEPKARRHQKKAKGQ